MKYNPLEQLETNELIEKLKSWGYGDLLTILLEDAEVYTKKGRLNKSGACRVLNWKNKQLEDALAACKQILHNEFD
jgi:hypothetical protein